MWRLFSASLVLAGAGLLVAQPSAQPPPLSPPTQAQSLPPELPDLDWQDIDAKVRPQVEAAYKRARTRPEDPTAAGLLAMTLQAFGKNEPAERVYRRARALAADSFRWTYGLGTVQQALEQRAEAVEALRAAVSLRPDYAPAYSRLGDVLRVQGALDEAAEAYRLAIERDSEYPPAHLGLGRLRELREDWQGAVEAYERACELATSFATAHYALGLAYRKLGDAAKAGESLRRYQELRERPAPAFDPFIEAIESLRGGGSSTESSERTFTSEQKERFVGELNQALAANPQLVSAHANLIALHWELGRPQQAEEHYQAAIAIDPDSARAHYNWGRIEFTRGNMEAAAAAFEKALEGDPHHADALVQSGLLLERQGQAEEAERRYQRALETNPVHRQAHYLLARSLMRGGDYAAAIEHLEETIRPDDPATPRYMRALASTYLRAGDRQKAIETLQDAHGRAAALDLGDLVTAIEGDLERLGAAPVTQ